MNKKFTPLIIVFAVIIIIIIIAEASSPKKINWDSTYATADKIPFGLSVFDKEAPELFKGNKVKKFTSTPYEYLDANFDYDKEVYKVNGSLLAIGNADIIDPESARELLNYADYGNTVLLSIEDLPPVILDTLKLHLNGFDFTDSLQVSMAKTPKEKYWISQGRSYTYFDSLTVSSDSLKILGYAECKGKKRPNFVEARFGNGRILLHTQPAVFSNYYLLNKGGYSGYAEKVVSAMPAGTVYWRIKASGISDSALRYITSEPALYWAWYLGLIGLVVFIFFNAKRKQRLIPILPPLRNTTVDFTKTIGNLYFLEGSHQDIINKKIVYFLEHVRTVYLIDTANLNDTFAERLHLKTGKPTEDIQNAIALIKKHRNQFSATPADVIVLNNAIDKLRL